MSEQRIIIADVLDGLRQLPDGSVQCCVTSPPYWGLRDYGVAGQIGLEKTPAEFIARMVEVFREVRRVLRDDGVCFCNIGDSYATTTKGSGGHNPKQDSNVGSWHDDRAWQIPPGLKPKDLCGIPWQLAFALRDDGWYLRQDIIWHKPAPMPESVRDRCTKSHEYIFLLTKRGRYYYDAEAVKEPLSAVSFGQIENFNRVGAGCESLGALDTSRNDTCGLLNKVGRGSRGAAMSNLTGANLRSVWTMASQGFSEAHFATFPIELPERCIRAGTSAKGCCPDCGAAWKRIVTTRRVATRPGTGSKVNGRDALVTGNRDPLRHTSESTTTGWERTCAHDAEPVPCTVLDPFCGAATTLLAAQRLGRNGIGIELNPEYAAMGKRRLEGEAPLLAKVI